MGKEAASFVPKNTRGATIKTINDTMEEGRNELMGREAAIPVPKGIGEAAIKPLIEAEDDTTEECRRELLVGTDHAITG